MRVDAITKPILVTGAHRSGSTWVGRMIATSPSVGYIHEPFNIRHHPGVCRAIFDNWFTYICDENAHIYHDDLKQCIEFKYQLLKGLRAIKSPTSLGHLLKDGSHFTKCRFLKKRPLMKDPIAIFSAEWLARMLDMAVVIVIRHPAAFAGSLKKANASHPFLHFLKQPLLMQHHLHGFRSEIQEYSKTKQDIVDQAILLWNCIHSVVLKYKENHRDWVFVRHVDLCNDPLSEFQKIFDNLELDFSPSVKNKIARFSSSKNPAEPRSDASIKRFSKANQDNWKNRLTNEEIERVKEKTYNISRHFYEEIDWSR